MVRKGGSIERSSGRLCSYFQILQQIAVLAAGVCLAVRMVESNTRYLYEVAGVLLVVGTGFVFDGLFRIDGLRIRKNV